MAALKEESKQIDEATALRFAGLTGRERYKELAHYSGVLNSASRAANKLIEERELVYSKKRDTFIEVWRKQKGLADAWKANTTALTTAVGLVLDRPQPAPSTRTTRPDRPPRPEGADTRFLGVALVVHLESGTWRGQLRVEALPPIGSGLRLDEGHLLRITDVEMDLNGKFTVHAEVAPAGPLPSRGVFTKLGLTRTA